MEIESILKNKKIKITEIPRWGTFLRKQWEDNFANHLSIEEKKNIYFWNHSGFCGYLWHLFSYEKKTVYKDKQPKKLLITSIRTLVMFFGNTQIML